MIDQFKDFQFLRELDEVRPAKNLKLKEFLPGQLVDYYDERTKLWHGPVPIVAREGSTDYILRTPRFIVR